MVALLIKNGQTNISSYKSSYVEKTVKVLNYGTSRGKHLTVISTTSGPVILYMCILFSAHNNSIWQVLFSINK